MLMKHRKNHGLPLALITLFLVLTPQLSAHGKDLNFQGIHEAALDLPRIYFILKHNSAGPPILFQGRFELNYAYLDTGASGILMSLETVSLMGLDIEPGARFVDVGVGGDEYFGVSKPLYIGTAGYPAAPPAYAITGPWRFQVCTTQADPLIGPIDIIGIPAMAGKTVVFNPGATNSINYFGADIKEPNDPDIPRVDFEIALRFEKFINPSDPRGIPPLPVQSYNPVIDNVTVERNGIASTGTWLFDTGSTISLISVKHAARLGLTNVHGDPIVPTQFWVPIGGIGAMVILPGFRVDSLKIPTLCGYNLVFDNPRIAVHDIGVIDEKTGQYKILEGILGSNFLCATMNLSTWDIRQTPFRYVVLDTQNAILGFDVFDRYPLPDCNDIGMGWHRRDLNRDGRLNSRDLRIFVDEWLNDCDWLNWNCRGADFNDDGRVDFPDFAPVKKPTTER